MSSDSESDGGGAVAPARSGALSTSLSSAAAAGALSQRGADEWRDTGTVAMRDAMELCAAATYAMTSLLGALSSAAAALTTLDRALPADVDAKPRHTSAYTVFLRHGARTDWASLSAEERARYQARADRENELAAQLAGGSLLAGGAMAAIAGAAADAIGSGAGAGAGALAGAAGDDDAGDAADAVAASVERALKKLRPKRALSGYVLFVREQYGTSVNSGEFSEAGNVIRELGARWKAMSEDEKRPYGEQAAALREDAAPKKKAFAEARTALETPHKLSGFALFQAAVAGELTGKLTKQARDATSMWMSLSDEQRQEFHERVHTASADEAKAAVRRLVQLARALKILSVAGGEGAKGPGMSGRRGPSAFMLFAKDVRPTLANGSTSFAEQMQTMARMWKELPEAVRERYCDAARQERDAISSTGASSDAAPSGKRASADAPASAKQRVKGASAP